MRATREFVLTSGKRLRPAFCYWGWRGTGAADDDGLLSGRRRPRAAPRLRAGPRRRHGRLRHPAREPGRAPPVRRPAPHRRLVRERRTASARAQRSCWVTSAWPGPTRCWRLRPGPAQSFARPADLRPDAHRADGRPVPRSAGAGPGRAGRAGRNAPCRSPATRPRSTPSSGPCSSVARSPGRRRPARHLLPYGLPLGEAFQLRDDLLGVSATRQRPANRPATTCARASARCWCPLADERATPAQDGAPRPAARRPRPRRRGRGGPAGDHRRTGAVAEVEKMIGERAGAARAALDVRCHRSRPAMRWTRWLGGHRPHRAEPPSARVNGCEPSRRTDRVVVVGRRPGWAFGDPAAARARTGGDGPGARPVPGGRAGLLEVDGYRSTPAPPC